MMPTLNFLAFDSMLLLSVTLEGEYLVTSN